MDVGKAWPGHRPPPQSPTPPALPASLTFALGSASHRDGGALLRGPKAPAAGGRGRGRRWGGVEAEPGVGGGLEGGTRRRAR